MMYTCIIADDEPLARDLLNGFVEKVPFLTLKGIFNDAWSVKEYLRSNSVDLLLLDIEMPGLDGLTFLKTQTAAPQVIFITAHRQYAVDAFELEALDYVLKPVSFERFLKAVSRISSAEQVNNTEKTKDYIYISVERRMEKIRFQDIDYIEAKGDYLKFVIDNEKPILSKITLKDCLDKLDQSFVQIHRSFIVNRNKITAYQQEKLRVKDTWLNISRSFRNTLDL